MSAVFPSEAWLDGLREKLNTDGRYNEIAKNWEGDLFFVVELAGTLQKSLMFHIGLWHGRCTGVVWNASAADHPNPAFVLSGGYDDITGILSGRLNPMTAMLTNKLRVKGSLGYMMRNVPTVLDFVRCCQEVTASIA